MQYPKSVQRGPQLSSFQEHDQHVEVILVLDQFLQTVLVDDVLK